MSTKTLCLTRSVTIGYVTARREPEFQWFVDSLASQLAPSSSVKIVLVDFLATSRDMSRFDARGFDVRHVPPKPTVWQGPHRLTKSDWWAVSAYRNTAACLCSTEWLATIDDRSVLLPTYARALERAMLKNTAVCGRYEKRRDMIVEGGVIKGGVIIGHDPRWEHVEKQRMTTPIRAPGGWFFGANTAQPIEFVLTVNGWDEGCDSLGLEDCVYGSMLERNRLPISYDPELALIQDRSAAAVEPPLAKRMDKGVSPNDKSHGILKRTADVMRAEHNLDLRADRERALRGEPFEIPTGPTHDWWDQQPLSEFV